MDDCKLVHLIWMGRVIPEFRAGESVSFAIQSGAYAFIVSEGRTVQEIKDQLASEGCPAAVLVSVFGEAGLLAFDSASAARDAIIRSSFKPLSFEEWYVGFLHSISRTFRANKVLVICRLHSQTPSTDMMQMPPPASNIACLLTFGISVAPTLKRRTNI
jgi:hypothetical protein